VRLRLVKARAPAWRWSAGVTLPRSQKAPAEDVQNRYPLGRPRAHRRNPRETVHGMECSVCEEPSGDQPSQAFAGRAFRIEQRETPKEIKA